LLDRLALLELTSSIQTVAGGVKPYAIRSLDAIHLASAMSLGELLEVFVTYDRRLAEAAAGMGLEARSPA
jgi:predicted nucleic acid-binding protein